MIQAEDLVQLPGNERAGRKARFLFAHGYTSNANHSGYPNHLIFKWWGWAILEHGQQPSPSR